MSMSSSSHGKGEFNKIPVFIKEKTGNAFSLLIFSATVRRNYLFLADYKRRNKLSLIIMHLPNVSLMTYQCNKFDIQIENH